MQSEQEIARARSLLYHEHQQLTNANQNLAYQQSLFEHQVTQAQGEYQDVKHQLEGALGQARADLAQEHR